jgi:hypothetical protein
MIVVKVLPENINMPEIDPLESLINNLHETQIDENKCFTANCADVLISDIYSDGFRQYLELDNEAGGRLLGCVVKNTYKTPIQKGLYLELQNYSKKYEADGKWYYLITFKLIKYH